MKFQIIKKKECYVLNRKVLWAIVFVLIVLLYMFVRNIHEFLSLNEPVNAQVLVIDGLLADYALEQAAVEFNKHDNYRFIVTSGGDIPSGVYVSEYKTMAELTKASLIKLGVNKKLIIAIPGQNTKRNRTYSSALNLKEWLINQKDVKAINIFTIGCHSRRSRVEYEMALEHKIKVGTISVPDKTYDTTRWWAYSRGMRSVISELIGYIYAKFFLLW